MSFSVQLAITARATPAMINLDVVTAQSPL
jgi:hypothetical protein